MSERATPAVMAALKEALQGQITTNDPPETALTFARLQREGMSEDEAWRWLSAAFLQEMSIMIRDNRAFDRAGFVCALDRLPGLIDR
jgi:ribosomal protein S12 methylthiotransferase accessory factor YcaO